VSYSTRRKRSTVYWQLFLAVVLFFCCLYSIWTAAPIAASQQVWLDGIFVFLYDYPFISKIITSVFLLVNAVLLVFFLRRFSLIELRNYYPALFYLLFIFMFSQIMNPWSMLTGFFIIVGVFPQLFDLDENNIQSKTFMYGLWCGILAVIDFYFIFLLLFIYLVCLLDRIYTFRSFILPVVGASVSFIYLFSILYLTNNAHYINDFFSFTWQKMQEMSLLNVDIHRFSNVLSANHYMSGILLVENVLLAIFSFFKLWSKASSAVINKRKKYYIFLLFIFLSAIYILLFQTYNVLLNHMLLILYTIIFCLGLSYMKRYGFLLFVLVGFFVISVMSIFIK
jgi:hypothetical protein